MKIKKDPPPPWRFIFAHPSHFIACGMGSGLSPIISGTAGTLFAWLLFPLLQIFFAGNDAGFAVFPHLAFAYGVYASDQTGRALGVADHGAIVWDEIVPFWLVLFMTPPDLLWQLGAFLLFRFFDIVKPPPANWFDEKIKNGLGVMMDDVIAAGYAILVIALVKALLG